MMRFAALALATAVLVSAPAPLAQDKGHGEHWVATWATATMGRPSQGPPPPPSVMQSSVNITNQTIRQIVRVSLGGDRVRVVFSNTFGTEPLTIGAAYLAHQDNGAVILPNPRQPLTFAGKTSGVIAAGAVIVSDTVNMTVAPVSNLVIDLYLPGDTGTSLSPATIHAAAHQTSYVSTPGNHVGVVNFPVHATTRFLRANVPTGTWFYLARVEVMAPSTVGAIATIGDSITDGHESGLDTNNRWPDHLARRLRETDIPMAILNVGAGGNRLLTHNPAATPSDSAPLNMQARFDRDVLAQTGITHVIVLAGINDIGSGRDTLNPTADELIEAHRQLIERAHARGLKIYGATLTPFEGAMYWSPVGEAKRQALNQWIRTSKAYDAVFDFDAATRDPNRPTRFLPTFDPGDHLHPNAAGYRAMAEAVDLALFKTTSGQSSER